MTMAVTRSDISVTEKREVEVAQDAELAALIRRLATKRPEILTAWTASPPPRPAVPPVPAPVPVSRRPHPLPMPRPLPALAPHPVTGDWPTREDFPVDRATVASLARLRAIAAGTHKPHAHGPAHATDAYLAKKRRPSLFLRTLRRIRHIIQKALAMCDLISAAVLTGTLAAGLLPTGFL